MKFNRSPNHYHNPIFKKILKIHPAQPFFQHIHLKTKQISTAKSLFALYPYARKPMITF